jgi:translocator protein
MKRDILRQFAVIATTIYALVLNGASNAIPLNNRSTAQISDSFNVLFVPAGYVFAIWGVIYLFMLAYMVYQALPAHRQDERLRRTGWLFAAANVLNGTWIVFWHYATLNYLASLVTMLGLLAALVAIYLRLDIGRASYSGAAKWAVAGTFSVYLGWITVAAIANIEDVLSLYWNGAPLSATAWTLILLAAGVVIGGIMSFTRRDVGYALVLVWAFSGISVRWIGVPVLNAAGFVAAALVLVLLIASRLPQPLRQRLQSPA